MTVSSDSGSGLPTHTVKGPLVDPLVHTDGEISFRDIADLIWSGRWLILVVASVVLALSLFYVWTAKPQYQSMGLVQAEQKEKGLGSAFNELSAMMGSGAVSGIAAEIAIIKSRMILGTVAEKMKLPIKVRPNYFPLFGEAVARRRADLPQPAEPMLGLSKFAWGGEKITVSVFDVPESLQDTAFRLVAGSDGSYSIVVPGGLGTFNGKVGESAAIKLGDEQARIFVQELKARPGTEFSLLRRSPGQMYSLMQSRLTVAEQAKESGIIQITYQDEDAAAAAAVVNVIEDEYLRQNVERKSEEAEQSLQFVNKQLPEVKTSLEEAQAKLNSYQLDKGTADVQKETDLALNRAVELETQRLSLQQQREAALQRFTLRHPIVQTLDEQIRALSAESEKLKEQVRQLPARQQEIFSLMRDLKVNSELYVTLLNSSQQLQVAKAGTVGSVRIIDRALKPRSPSAPNKGMIVSGAFVMGLFIGLVMVFIRRALLRGVDRPDEVEQKLGLPTYASIPFSSQQRRVNQQQRGNKASSKILAHLASNDPAIEALRSLRTSIHFALMESGSNVVMLTGPVPGIGKSFVSINFGAVLAMGGKRVAVVDCDLRRGTIHKYLDGDAGSGVSDYVVDAGLSYDSIVRNTPVEGLALVSRGTSPPNPSEVLLHARFSDLVARLSENYDYVLLDTPPVLPVADASIIGQLAGCTLVVLKSAEHPLRAIEETIRRLRHSNVEVKGVVFNQVGAKMGSYGYYGYGYGYDYAYKY